jgi:fatty acyl-CoA reductase
MHLHSPKISKMTSSDIDRSLKFWRGKNVFLTGVTGFVGKVFIEKLLREFGDDCGTLYVLIRAKTIRSRKPGVPDELRDVDGRLRAEVYDTMLFDPLRASRADFEKLFFSKVRPISGELSREGGVSIIDSADDLALLRRTVHVVVHSAASVSFNEPLGEALVKNVGGALEMFELGRSFDALECYMHVSTAYVNCHRFGQITEATPTLEFPAGISDIEDYYRHLKSFSDAELDARCDALLGNFPNTYCFSKAIAEQLIEHRRGHVPLAVVRPSIIGASAVEPFRGWTDSANAGSFYRRYTNFARAHTNTYIVGAVMLFTGLGYAKEFFFFFFFFFVRITLSL